MHPDVVRSIRNCIDYGWKDSVVINLIKCKHRVSIKALCIEHFRTGNPCPEVCRERCRIYR